MDYAMTATFPRVVRRPQLAVLLGGVLLAAAACASAPEQSEDLPELSEASTEQSEATSEQSEAAPEPSEAAPEQSEAAPEPSEAAPQQSEAAPVQSATATAVLTGRDLDRALVSQPFSHQHTAALTRESALYAYHFTAGTSELTTLGRRVLHAITDAARSGPREIFLSPGACVPEALGAARLASVRAHVQKHGSQGGQVLVTVGYARGEGAATKDVAARLRAFEQRPMTATRSLSSELGR